MDEAIRQTNRACTWFFLAYYFMVGVLTTQLIVGILIGTFGAHETSESRSVVGEVTHAFEDILYLLPDREQIELVRELGDAAQYILEATIPSCDMDCPEQYIPWKGSAMGGRMKSGKCNSPESTEDVWKGGNHLVEPLVEEEELSARVSDKGCRKTKGCRRALNGSQCLSLNIYALVSLLWPAVALRPVVNVNPFFQDDLCTSVACTRVAC